MHRSPRTAKLHKGKRATGNQGEVSLAPSQLYFLDVFILKQDLYINSRQTVPPSTQSSSDMVTIGHLGI